MERKPRRERPASPASPGALCQARVGFIWWEWVSPGWGRASAVSGRPLHVEGAQNRGPSSWAQHCTDLTPKGGTVPPEPQARGEVSWVLPPGWSYRPLHSDASAPSATGESDWDPVPPRVPCPPP